MRDFKIEINIRSFRYEELDELDRELVDAAKEATHRSYAPYSHFSVGAAVRLADGTIVTGSNQENAAYPSGTCAERTALFYANARHPDLPVHTMAVAARDASGFLTSPIPPCGACRQVLLETENRYHHPMRIILFGTEESYLLDGTSSLLPLSFGMKHLKGNGGE